MTIQEFKKVARLLKEVYAELEKEAIAQNISLLSPEYDELVSRAREALLSKMGFTLEEYRTVKEQVAGVSKEGTLAVMQETQKKIDELSKLHIPTREEIMSIAHEVAREYIVAPIIKHEIVKEITVEKPRIIETVREITKKEVYNDSALREEISRVESKIPTVPAPFNPEPLKEELRNEFQQNLEHNIDALGMPDFRKLGMGLQSQLDDKVTSYTTDKLTVSTTQPTNPQLYDLWLDIN
jgi:hypothetical protein